MKLLLHLFLALTLAALGIAGCSQTSNDESNVPDLVGAWRANIQFQNGTLAEIKDLEFMYLFNYGGTMTESSNYDAAPPCPPAYGVWQRISANQFEARYEFYVTRPPDSADGMAAGNGWLPAGRGGFTEKIRLSDDGQTFTSEMKYEPFDRSGNPVEGGGTATVTGRRIKL